MDRHLHLRPHCAHIVSPRALAHRLALLTLTSAICISALTALTSYLRAHW